LSERPTFEASEARIDLLGQPLLSRLTARSQGQRLALLGDWSALFRLLCGEAQLAAGKLELMGHALPLGVEQGKIGVMRLDTLLPPSFSGEQLLASSAELAGLSRKAATGAAFATLDRLGLGALASRRLGHLQLGERRALLLAHALLTDPELLCLEQPLSGLDGSAEQLLLAAIERALGNRSLIVSLDGGTPSPGERELLARSNEQLRLSAGVVVQESEHTARVKRFTATVCRNHHAFANALAQRGLRAHPTHEAGLLGSLTSPQAGPAWRYLVELSDESTSGILDAAIETDAGLLELLPA
jgi:ABC-type molybdenum transport system ATPase subunit/photorepair protein PhrA